MTEGQEDELIGTGLSDIAIERQTTELRLEFAPGALRQLASAVAAAPDHERVYLRLEGIRGTRDATTLTVYLRLPHDAASVGQAEFRAGTAGLYGVRRASVRSSPGSGEGLQSTFDVTPFFSDLSGAAATSLNTLIVSIRLGQAPSDSPGITIGQVILLHRRYG